MNRLCVLMILLACVGCVCEKSSDTYDEDFVRQVDSIVNADRSIDSLVVVLERFEEDGNEYGIVASCRELGRPTEMQACSPRPSTSIRKDFHMHRN